MFLQQKNVLYARYVYSLSLSLCSLSLYVSASISPLESHLHVLCQSHQDQVTCPARAVRRSGMQQQSSTLITCPVECEQMPFFPQPMISAQRKKLPDSRLHRTHNAIRCSRKPSWRTALPRRRRRGRLTHHYRDTHHSSTGPQWQTSWTASSSLSCARQALGARYAAGTAISPLFFVHCCVDTLTVHSEKTCR